MASTRRFTTLALWMIAAAAFAGCADQSPPSPAGGASPAAAPASGAAPPGRPKSIANDRSLTPGEYIASGMPAHDRAWAGKDMVAAAQVITRLAATPEKLPRYQSDRSGEMFARITSAENLGYYRHKPVPIAARLPDAIESMGGLSAITKVYLASMLKSGKQGEELIELTGATLRAAVVMVELIDEFLPTLDPKDPSYPARMNGLKTMRGGLATMVAGSLQTLTESDTYPPESRKRLIAALDETLPGLLPALPEGARAETAARLKTYAADPKMSALQPELGRLAETAANAASPKDQ